MSPFLHFKLSTVLKAIIYPLFRQSRIKPSLGVYFSIGLLEIWTGKIRREPEQLVIALWLADCCWLCSLYSSGLFLWVLGPGTMVNFHVLFVVFQPPEPLILSFPENLERSRKASQLKLTISSSQWPRSCSCYAYSILSLTPGIHSGTVFDTVVHTSHLCEKLTYA